MQNTIIFFRNDDVGLYSTEPIARELIDLTDLFLNACVPICHAAVPFAINKETVNWLKKKKQSHPNLISIGQHGFKHVKYERGEFGGNRGYDNQKTEISKGMKVLSHHFGPYFSNWFAAPWVAYNRQTKKICNELGFKVFSGGVSPKWYARIFNSLGRLLNLNVMIGKEVSYHRKNTYTQYGFTIPEISVSVDVTRNYKLKIIKNLDCIKDRYKQCKKRFNVIGFLLHQWVFDSSEKLEIIEKLLFELQEDPNISFSLIESIEN